jgi:hypothetical protein
VPVWHDARDELPFLFAASSAASAGAAAAIAVLPAKAGPARRAAVGGTLAALALEQLMVKKLGFVGEPYEQDDAGRASKLAKGLTAAGAAMIGLGGRRSRLAAATGGALLLAGEVALRWSVYKAGFQSAKNPLYTVQPQRERADRDGTRVTTKPRNPAQGAG